MLSLFLVAAAAWPQIPDFKPTLSGLAEMLQQQELDNDPFPPIAIRLLELPNGVATKDLEVDAKHTTDATIRASSLVLHEGKPHSFVFTQSMIELGDTETWYIRTDLEGSPLVAVVLRGRKTPSGDAIPGSGTSESVSVTSIAVKIRLKRDLDFWLRGRFRKPAPAPKAKPALKK